MTIDGLSLSVLIKELHAKLIGGRIDKIFQTDKYTLLLAIRIQGENVKLIISANPQQPRIHLLTDNMVNPEVPPAFCMLLRKHLEDGRIASVTQEGLDRIVKINIDVRGERGELVTKTLTAELMGKYSNIILTSEEDIIIDSIKRVYHTMSRQREVLPGHRYIKPPEQEKISLLSSTDNQLLSKLISQNITITKALLNTCSGLGPVTIKEILYRAGIPSEYPVENLDDADWTALLTAVHTIIDDIQANHMAPTTILDNNKKLLGVAAFKLEHLANYTVLSFSNMSNAIEYISLLKPPQLPEKEIIKKTVNAEIAKLQRKHKTLLKELADANDAEQIKYYADNIMAYIYNIPKGASNIELDDIYSTSPEPKKLKISLNPELSAVDNAQNYYHKYNKYKRAQSSLTEQITMCVNSSSYLEGILVSIDAATTLSDVADIKQELAAYGLIKLSSKKKPAIKASAPIKISFNEYTIYVGKNNRQNDLLTFKIASPNDLWFHTKDIPGSHVILQSSTPTPEAIYAAAQLAANFSKAKDSTKVPVDYTQRRCVKKPAHAKPGFVIYEHQNTIYVSPDEIFINKLLEKHE